MFLYPTPDLPDDTPIDHVRFFTRVRNALTTAGVKTVGEIREASDARLLSLQDLGKGLSLIFGRRWAFPQPMGSGPWAKSPPDLLNFNEEIPRSGERQVARACRLRNASASGFP